MHMFLLSGVWASHSPPVSFTSSPTSQGGLIFPTSRGPLSTSTNSSQLDGLNMSLGQPGP